MENGRCSGALHIGNFCAVERNRGGGQHRTCSRASVVSPVDCGIGATKSSGSRVQVIDPDYIRLAVGDASDVQAEHHKIIGAARCTVDVESELGGKHGLCHTTRAQAEAPVGPQILLFHVSYVGAVNDYRVSWWNRRDMILRVEQGSGG